MREIEFRAYLKKNKQIVDVLDIDFMQETIGYMNKSDTKYTCVKFDDIELMQYTGFKDKNGKKIFEGDILKVISKESAIDNQDHYDYVVFSDGCFCMANAFMFGELSYGCDYDVVGNIYDNKELLEEEDGNK